MTITIYSIINGVLWSCLMAIPLFFLSRSSKVICYCGTMPLFVIAIGCIFRSVFIVEFRSAQEIGVPVMLNPVNSFMIQAANGVSLEIWFSRIWAIGSVIAACFWLFAYVVQFRVTHGLSNSTDERIEKFRQENNAPNLRGSFTEKVETPCVVGIFHETILLPEQFYTERQLNVILAHEYAHICHHDGLIDFGTRLLCIAFWWNPATYLSRVSVSHLCDCRCDLKVTENANDEDKRFYCDTLLEFASKKRGIGRHFSGADLKTRFYLILKKGRDFKNLFLLAAVTTAFLLFQTYLLILQPAHQPSGSEYTDFALTPNGSYVVQAEDKNYQVVAGGESFLLSENEMDQLIREGIITDSTK